MMTAGSKVSKCIALQVADVHKPLLSISGCVGMGFDCFLGGTGGHLTDRETGETIPLERRENLYIMRAWIRQDPGIRVSQPFCLAELAHVQHGAFERLLTPLPALGKFVRMRRQRMKAPQMPTKAKYDAHMTLHADYRDRSPDCVAGPGISPQHRSSKKERTGRELSLDYPFMTAEAVGEDMCPVLVGYDNESHGMWA